MERLDWKSTALTAATYQDQSALLELEFRGGAIYRYAGVPSQVYQEQLIAESKGRYFNLHIRDRFTHAKIDPAPSGASRDPAIEPSTK